MIIIQKHVGVFKKIPAVNNNGQIVNFKGANATDSFNVTAKIAGQTGDKGIKEVEIMVPLKYLINQFLENS